MRSLTAPLSGHFGHHDAVRLAEVLKVLSHPNRLLLINLLRGGEQNSHDLIAAMAGISQPTVSHHLKVLIGAGLVTRRWGRGGGVPSTFYQLVPGGLADVAEVLGQGDRR